MSAGICSPTVERVMRDVWASGLRGGARGGVAVLRIGLERELDVMNRRVLELVWDVDDYLGEMVEFLEGREAEADGRGVGYDARLKMRGEEIEDDCLLLQARQAPVARDLRFVHSVCAVANHAVRTGTLCEHVFRVFEASDEEPRRHDLDDAISRMSREACGVFRQGLEIFESRDIRHARSLKAADKVVDRLCAEVMELAADGGGSSVSPGKVSQAALVAHYLERIADHGVDIGMRTVFLVEGEEMAL